uniref:Cysteine-rich protein n=1 Tax=Spironucleus salmonicida TaxID=348837 RepID=V6LY27_9EUKA|eukprot:EST45684.1 Cysteine-rich protein [Spironucleus salmonicida]
MGCQQTEISPDIQKHIKQLQLNNDNQYLQHVLQVQQISIEETCFYCLQKSPSFELLCGHKYHSQCVQNQYKSQQICECGYDFLTDVLPVLFCVEQECSICFEKCLNDIKRLQCGHILHQQCFNDLLAFSKRCPVCRSAIE